MNRNRTRKPAAVAMGIVAVLGCSAVWAAHQEKSAPKTEQKAEPPAAQTPAARPGAAEMERLKFYLGEWDYTETYGKTPFLPNGGTGAGMYTSKLGPGGNSLVNTFHSHGAMGESEGLLILTWSPKENAYRAYAFGNDFPGALEETGQFEGDALVFRGEFSAGGAKMALRNSTRVVAPGKIESDEYISINGAPETPLVKVEAKKK